MTDTTSTVTHATSTASAAAPATADAAAASDPLTGPASGPASAEQVIAADRRRIDDLDARIIALVRERVEVSRRVQAARTGAGGRRVHLAREMEILRAYGDALGRPGTSVAMALLELCRGTV